MTAKTFKIPMYKISVTLLQIEGKYDADKVKPYLKAVRTNEEDTAGVLENIRSEYVDAGITFRLFESMRMLVIFYPHTSEIERKNTYSHEKRHIEDRVLQFAGVDDIESAAILAGWLGERFAEFEKLQLTKNDAEHS